MKIKYCGGRSHYEVSYNRKPYYFTPENNRVLDIREKEVVNYIFSLPNRAEFEVVVEAVQEKKPEIKVKVEVIEEKEIKKRGRPKKEK